MHIYQKAFIKNQFFHCYISSVWNESWEYPSQPVWSNNTKQNNKKIENLMYDVSVDFSTFSIIVVFLDKFAAFKNLSRIQLNPNKLNSTVRMLCRLVCHTTRFIGILGFNLRWNFHSLASFSSFANLWHIIEMLNG